MSISPIKNYESYLPYVFMSQQEVIEKLYTAVDERNTADIKKLLPKIIDFEYYTFSLIKNLEKEYSKTHDPKTKEILEMFSNEQIKRSQNSLEPCC